MRLLSCFIFLAMLSGCGNTDLTTENSEIIRNQTGRFAFVAASEGYPPMVLDTAAGCVMAISKSEDGVVEIDEVAFPEGTNSCNASKQLLVADTLKRVLK